MKAPPIPPYFIRLFWSEEDRCYVAEVPELRGCSGLGETPEKALREARRSIRSWLEVARKQGVTIPKPIVRGKSARLNLRLPSEVVRGIKMEARESGLSLNQYVMTRLLRAS